MDNQTDFNSPLQSTPQTPPNVPVQPNHMNSNYNYNQNAYLMPSILDSLSGWMKFIGIYTIVVGALTCIGIITAALGVPMIFSGIALTNASKSIKTYNDYNNSFTLNEFLTFLNKYFKIQGIFVIIGIVLSVLYIAFILVFTILSVYSYTYY